MEGRKPLPPPPWRQNPAQPRPYNPLTELIGVVKSVIWSVGFISFIAVLVLSLVIVLAMTPDIQQWITTPVPSENDPGILVLPKEYIYIITPWLLILFSMDGAAFQAWHFLILGILVGAFALAKYDLFRNWLSKRGAAARSLLVPEKATSSMEGTAKLFMASISFSMIYLILLSIMNIDMRTPPFDEYSIPELIYGLFNASVFEELVSRVLLVGVPLAIIGTLKGWERPGRKLLGGGSGLTPITFGLIIFSSVMFAFAHVVSWDLWKVPQVLVTGMALGWAFVRYGLHASILIHFSINLSFSATEIWPDNTVVMALLGVVLIIWMFAGGYFFLHYCIELWTRFMPGKRAARAQGPSPHWQQSVPPPPPQWQGQGTVPPPDWAREHAQPHRPPPPGPANSTGISGGFVCPKCSHTDATYDAGKLTCLRCGSVRYRDVAAEETGETKQVEF